ncbi:hypothetical protein HELRODRAFT_164188 [Helobdella robusta]|uniref:Uncharacterized protein n=1 Tax=Helobdella robusta TaxID=6412 RepID=T1EV27_HELRO|nr:hypothetical protein HELRODRAFT_164188 [Helobdella robusta]ESN94359.1 hypothetical protein HELRODRAFT_164188 [Helobdella robusta]
MFKSLKTTVPDVETNKSENELQQFQHTTTSSATPNPLPGIKLPKTQSQWAEANAYFHQKFVDLCVVEDINHFTSTFQNTIYNYFANTFGTVKPKTSTNQNSVIKQLKKKLKNLKILGRNNNSFNNDIIAVSKLIRSKLHNSKRPGKSADQSDVSIQLSKNFWKACKQIFSPTTTTPPSFDVEKGCNFFYSAMKADDKCNYNIPDWIPSLPLPSFGGDVGPPTYEEVSNIVRRTLVDQRA